MASNLRLRPVQIVTKPRLTLASWPAGSPREQAQGPGTLGCVSASGGAQLDRDPENEEVVLEGGSGTQQGTQCFQVPGTRASRGFAAPGFLGLLSRSAVSCVLTQQTVIVSGFRSPAVLDEVQRAGPHSPEASLGGACLASSRTCCSPRCSLTPRHTTAVSAPVVAWLSSLCVIFSVPKDPSHWTRPTPTQQVGPLHLLPPAKTLFLSPFTAHICGSRTYLIGRHDSAHNAKYH